MSEDLNDFFKLISEDKKKKKEEFDSVVGDLGLDSLFNEFAGLKKKEKEKEKKSKKKEPSIGNINLDSVFEEVSNLKKETKKKKVKEEKTVKAFEKWLYSDSEKEQEVISEVIEESLDEVLEVIEENKEELETTEEIEEKTFVDGSLEVLTEIGNNQSKNIKKTDKKFATLEDLDNHYKVFLSRIQQQLSSLGGGGIEDAPKTGGPYVRQGQKWIVSSNSGGAGLSTTGISTAFGLHIDPVGSGVTYGEDLVVIGDARVTGVLSIGTSSIVLNANNKTIEGVEQLKFKSLTLKENGNGIEIINGGDEAIPVGVGSTTSINTSGIITASAFFGNGSGLTGIVASGSGVVIQNNGSNVGTAATISFGDNLSIEFNSGIAAVSANIGYASSSGISSNATNLNNQSASYYLDYTNFTNTPTIFGRTGDLVNNSGFVTSGIVVGYATEGFVNNLVSISTFSRDYNDLSNTPTIPTNNNELTNGAGYITTSITSYNDLSNTPTVPTNNNELTNGAGYITTSITSYNDLSNTPTVPTNNNELTNGAGYITTSITSYNDLSNTPTALSSFSNDVGFVTSSIVVGYATETFVNDAVAGIVSSAPATLDTLNELASALGDDANFSTTVTNLIGTKASLSGATFTGVVTATSFSGAIELSSDTSPQLGGNLDTNSNNIQFADSDEAIFGNNSDFRIKHDVQSGNHITSNDKDINIELNPDGSSPKIYIRPNTYSQGITLGGGSGNPVELYHNNSKKFETTGAGATVFGTMFSTGFQGPLTGTASNATNLNNQSASYYLNYNNFSNTPTIPTNNNELTNGAGYITTSITSYNDLSNTPSFVVNSTANYILEFNSTTLQGKTAGSNKLVGWWNSEGALSYVTVGNGLSFNGQNLAISDGDKGDITVSNSGATWSIDNGVVGPDELANTSVNAGSYTNTNITVDSQGRITSASNGSGGGISNVVEDTSPQLGGNLDLNSKFITGTGGINATGVVTATSFSGAIELSSDTTPQLGGLLDTNGNDIKFADTDEAIFGNNSDFRIKHDGTDNHITSNDKDINIELNPDGSSPKIYIRPNTYSQGITLGGGSGNPVELYHNNSKKFETTASGITVTGVVTATSFSGSLPTTDLTGTISAAQLAFTSVNPGSYTNTNITVDGQGRITSASNGSGGGGGVGINSSGTSIGTGIETINFVGSGLTASTNGTTVNVTIPTSTKSSNRFVASDNQTSFTGLNYTPGYVDVYMNGSKLDGHNNAEFTATSGTTIVLTDGASTGDIIEIVSLKVGTIVDLNGLSNVQEDTSPQLGGNLNLNSNNITGNGNINIAGTLSGSVDLSGLLKEGVNITAGKLSANLDIDLADGMVHLFTETENATATPNIRFNSSTSLNSQINVGESITIAIITTAGAAGYSPQLEIDGANVTEHWLGGSAPSSGGSGGLDVYTYNVIKTNNNSEYTVLANYSNFNN